MEKTPFPFSELESAVVLSLGSQISFSPKNKNKFLSNLKRKEKYRKEFKNMILDALKSELSFYEKPKYEIDLTDSVEVVYQRIVFGKNRKNIDKIRPVS